MVKFRNVRVKMKGGKSRIQRAMVLASGKLKFVKNIHHSKSSSARVKTVHTKRRNYNLRRKSKHSYSRGSLLRTIEKVETGIAAAAPAIMGFGEYGVSRAGLNVTLKYATGMSPDGFHWQDLVKGWSPLIASKLVWVGYHKISGLVKRL